MTTASKITLIRVAFIPLFMLLMYLSGGETGLWMWLSLVVFVIASLTDYVDGFIARKYNQVSDFGKFLDPLADKLLVIAAMTMFCEWGLFPAWALMIVLTREFAVTGLRLVAVGKDPPPRPTLIVHFTMAYDRRFPDLAEKIHVKCLLAVITFQPAGHLQIGVFKSQLIPFCCSLGESVPRGSSCCQKRPYATNARNKTNFFLIPVLH